MTIKKFIYAVIPFLLLFILVVSTDKPRIFDQQEEAIFYPTNLEINNKNINKIDYMNNNIIESMIEGSFNGWNGETVYKLTNGQYWQQSRYYYHYYYTYRPEVRIYLNNGAYMMHVEGDDGEDVQVRQIFGVIESQIDGEFKGWEGETIYKLTNGQTWQQSSYHYHYHYAYMPKVMIYPSNGGYKMHVDGDNDEEISVRMLR